MLVLGPLLFIIYTNELSSVVNSCELLLYADDTVIYYSSSNIRDLEQKLNSDLTNLRQWFNNNFLTLNVSKCKLCSLEVSERCNRVVNFH